MNRLEAEVGQLTPDLLLAIQVEANALLRAKMASPPALEDILVLDAPIAKDWEYSVGGLGGLRGIWHRLWAMLSLAHQQPGFNEGVEVLREEFEAAFGRALTDAEMNDLRHHAALNAEFFRKERGRGS